MGRSIDADVLRDDILHDPGYDNDTINHFLSLIDDAPAIDIARHGRWEKSRYSRKCSACTCDALYQLEGDEYPSRFCPSCGARMDKAVQNDPV